MFSIRNTSVTMERDELSPVEYIFSSFTGLSRIVKLMARIQVYKDAKMSIRRAFILSGDEMMKREPVPWRRPSRSPRREQGHFLDK